MEVLQSPIFCETATEGSKSKEQDKMSKGKAKGHRKKRRKGAKGPYASKNFLRRPKINAPANTTQFLCADKEYYLVDHGPTVLRSTSLSESDSLSSGSSSSTQLSLTPSELYNDRAACDSVFWDTCDKLFMEEFERMYDDVRVELLCNQSINELTTRCGELESAVHNLQYLLQKEGDKRQKIEELHYLRQRNAKLKQENHRLQNVQSSSGKTDTDRSCDVTENSFTLLPMVETSST